MGNSIISMKQSDLNKMSDKELIDMAKGLHDCIEVAECFGANDITKREWVEAELEKRGYEIIVDKTMSVIKKEV